MSMFGGGILPTEALGREQRWAESCHFLQTLRAEPREHRLRPVAVGLERCRSPVEVGKEWDFG